MTLPNLKSLLNSKNELAAWLQSWVDENATEISISDLTGKVLWGNGSITGPETAPIKCGDEIWGWVKGEDNSSLIAGLISMMLKKEAERKKLGTEVLGLYQELNVIFDFSEKLSQAIDPDLISSLTLEQAMHSIPSHGGLMLLWDDQHKQLIVPATSGESLFNEEQIIANRELLYATGLSGQSEIINDLSLLKEKGIIKDNVQSLIYAAMKVKHRIMGAIILTGKEPEQYAAVHLKLLVTLALQASTVIESALLYEKNIREVREREEAILRIHEVTKKFVPLEFIRSLGKESLTDVRLGDQVEKIVTVLFTDIRDFTSISEQMTPEANFRFVSSFNERLGPVIRCHEGFINQYLGDSIMAIFPRYPEDTLNAAIAMQHAVRDLNAERHSLGLAGIRAGIGMHTGPLIMGITGDNDRLDAATISDTVNSAARIESLTKYYKSSILLSGETLRHISNPGKFTLRHLGKVQLKGKYNLLSIYECLNGYSDEELDKKINLLPAFNEAMNYYFDQRFENAIHGFQSILMTDPEDHASEIFMQKAITFMKKGVPANWSGAEEMLSK